ncbi:sorting nexin [Fusarium albosuccineum]|uniref:Endosomal/vacuolar adapter protein YPT35 n=1 Tax=Fusarium albosuccineum TaxID=1237068 RepID=A0A8H4P5U4_9HYPO|nr:sorting nexin [Fusarium albosuccineum]
MATAVDPAPLDGSFGAGASPSERSETQAPPAEVFETPRTSFDHDRPSNNPNDGNHDTAASAISPISVTSPPYWLNVHGHQRSVSNMSAESVLPAGAITLRDNEASEHDDRNNACWAKSVEIVSYTIVNGSATNIGAFVVWNIRVETLNTFPGFEAAVPALPPKSVISKFRPRFLEKRRAGLQYFLNCILLNPEFSGSPVLKEFLFA